jgi:hypothetical protein
MFLLRGLCKRNKIDAAHLKRERTAANTGWATGVETRAVAHGALWETLDRLVETPDRLVGDSDRLVEDLRKS